jgi:OOP family OmpA-OmpF porin
MSRILSIAFLLACLVCSPAAQAGKIYFGASAGDASLEVAELDARFDVDDTGYKVFAGYRFLKFWALEAQYTDLGSFAADIAGTTIEADADLFGVAGLGILPVTPKVDFFVKIGYVRWDTSGMVSDAVDDVSLDDDGMDLSYGAGIAYRISRRTGLRLEYETFDFDNAEDVKFTSLGLQFKF